MRKILTMLGIVVMVIFTFGLVFAEGQEVSKKDPIVINMGNIDTPFELNLSNTNGQFSSTDIKCRAFKKILEAKSHGRFKVKIYPNGQLGNQQEMMEMNREGSLQMTGCSASPIVRYTKEFMAFQIPYIFKDVNVALKAMNGPLGEEFNELFVEKTGIRFLAWGFEGYFNVGTVNKKVVVPSDMKGLKIRSGMSAINVQIFKLLDAIATPIPFTEIYTSLQQRVIDGVSTPTGFHYALNLYEQEKYLNMADILFSWSPISINEKFYRSLSKEDQYLIKDAAVEAMKTFQGMVLWGRSLWMEELKKQGMEVIIPTPEQKALWIKTLRDPMIKWAKKQIGPEWVDKVFNASKEAEEKLYGSTQ